LEINISPERELTIEEKINNNIYRIISANNIDLSNPDEIMGNKNERIKLYHIINSSGIKYSYFATLDPLEKDSVYMSGGTSRIDQKSWPMDARNYINYFANFSFTHYLIQEYGLEKFLYLNVEDFSTLTYEEVFGKDYEELKIDWIQYLKDNIKDIELML